MYWGTFFIFILFSSFSGGIDRWTTSFLRDLVVTWIQSQLDNAHRWLIGLLPASHRSLCLPVFIRILSLVTVSFPRWRTRHTREFICPLNIYTRDFVVRRAFLNTSLLLRVESSPSRPRLWSRSWLRVFKSSTSNRLWAHSLRLYPQLSLLLLCSKLLLLVSLGCLSTLSSSLEFSRFSTILFNCHVIGHVTTESSILSS